MIDVTGKVVFLSGPMSGIEHFNAAEFASAHAALKEMGASYVFNPSMRYLAKGQRKLGAMTHEDWVCDCLHELTDRERKSQMWVDVIPMKYDMLVLLPGWRESAGSAMEVSVAGACGIPVFYIEDVVDTWDTSKASGNADSSR